MKLGGKTGYALNSLSEVVFTPDHVYETDEEIAEAKALCMGLDEDERASFWRDVKKETTNRQQTFARAKQQRYERELYARFGMFKDMPWAVRVLQHVEEFRVFGSPLLNFQSCVIILFMAWRGRMPTDKFAFLVAFLFSVHPVVVVFISLFFVSLTSRKRKPKKMASKPKGGGGFNDDQFVEVSSGGIEGLYTASLLASAGVCVKVSEPGDCFVNDARLGQRSRYENVLGHARRQQQPSFEWKEVGDAENGFAYAMHFPSMVVMRAGGEEWVESLREATGLDRELLTLLARRALGIAQDLFAYTAAQLPADNSLYGKVLSTKGAGATFEAAAAVAVDEALEKIGISDPERRSRLALAVDPTGASSTSFATWCWILAHNFEGHHFCCGLADALVSNVEARGGGIEYGAPCGETKKVLKLFYDQEQENLPVGIALFMDGMSCSFSRGGRECVVESTMPTGAVVDKLRETFGQENIGIPCRTTHVKINKKDSFLTSSAPHIVNGWFAAHRALGYTRTDVISLRRNLVHEVKKC